MSASNDPLALSKSRTSSSTVASASIRPRTKRFITGLEDFSEQVDSANNQANNTNSSSAVASPTNSYFESPFYSRVPSPIPSKHPSRSSSLRPTTSRNAITTNGTSLSSSTDLATSLSGIWGKSWTSLQGLASNVLGSDPAESIKDNPNRPTKPRPGASNRPALKQWGPPEQTQPGAGSNEERKALFRARKREELLLQAGRTGSHVYNAAAHYKRRNSDDLEASSLPPGELDNRDALVYVHQVSPADTLAGISIKFNCPMAAIKKANGMWTNDGIQIKKTLILPVDNCNVKGRRVAAPGQHQDDLLPGGASADAVKTPTQASISNWLQDNRRDSSATIKPVSNSTEPATPNQAPDVKITEEPPWTHESWILIEGHLEPIEIARLPRQNLGFFPRTRRKSNAFSDADVASHANSLDQPRPSVAASDSSSAIGAATGTKQSYHRSRRSSSSQDFAHRMVGPGGVGTLKGRGPSAPGPAEDKLTKVLGNSLHISNFMSGRRPSLDELESVQSSGQSSPNFANSGLDYFGLAVEGFVRKMTKSASQAFDQVTSSSSPTRYNSRQRQGVTSKRPAGTGVTTGASSTADPGLIGRTVAAKGPGDLIELENAFEIGEDDERDDYEHDSRFGDRDEADFAERGRTRSSGGRTPTNGRLGAPGR